MALYTTETGFEQGNTLTDTHFDVETLASGKLDIVHYTTLAAIPGMPAPYRGAYCMRVDLSTSTTDCQLQETGSWDIAQSAELYIRFMFWLGGTGSQEVVMADTNSFAIFALWSSTNTHEATIGINFTTANGFRLYVAELANETGASYAPFSLNKWHSIELYANWDTSANDGTLDCYLDGYGLTQITGLTQAAGTSGVIGVLGQDAGTTTGICLYDEVVGDAERIYPPYMRFPQDIIINSSQHVFVGPGIIDNISLLSGAGTNNILTLYDTDTAFRVNPTRTRVELKNTTNNELVDPAGMPIHVIRGCYVDLAGTDPRAVLKIRRAVAYGSDGAVRTYASKRKPYKQDT